jgi:two-component system, NtrC family, sensor histidine kinase KinB
MAPVSGDGDVLAALAVGVVVIGGDGRVRDWNPAAAALLNRSPQDAIGRAFPLELGPDGTPVEHQLGDRWLELTTTALPNGGGRVVAIHDLTPQKTLDQQRSLFLATTTHEIKTPLTVVSGFATTLLRRWDTISADDRDTALSAIVRRSEALVRLIDKLLVGFRAEAGQLQLERRAFELGPALASAAAGFEAVSEKHELQLVIPDDLPMAIGDPWAIEQIVGELLENAIKYSPDGGPLRVEARASGPNLQVSVADSGIGLSERDAQNVFTRYYRVDVADKPNVSGVGLGLYIVRQLVEAQGGTVRATGRPGHGSKFEFTIPQAAPEG